MHGWSAFVAVVLASQPPVATVAVATDTPAAAPVAVAATDAAPPCSGCMVVPALTAVKLELLAATGSKVSKSGDTFPIRLAAPVVVDGRDLIAAGAEGMGEVVHAKPGGGGGAGGELVLAARYLMVGDRRLILRSMHLAANGRSKTDTANALGVASAASPLPVGLLGLLIKGGQTLLPAGTLADAKTAAAFVLSPAAATPAAAAATIVSQGESQP